MKEEADILCTKVHAVCYAALIFFSANSFSSLQASEGLLGRYTPFGNSMRSLALLRLVGGKDFWKSVRAASSWCFGTWFGTLIFLPAFLQVRNFPNVSVPLGIGLCWVFPF